MPAADSSVHLPTKRQAKIYPTALGHGFSNATLGPQDPSYRGDYAINGGTKFQTWESEDVSQETDGIVTARCLTAQKDITDGVSNTILIAEKYLNPDRYMDGCNDSDNEPAVSGDSRDQVRWGTVLPHQDIPGMDSWGYGFGSAHFSSYGSAFADGSVRHIRYGIPYQLYLNLLNKADGQVVNMVGFVD